MGCRKFRNYMHILQVSRNGEWVDGGKFRHSGRLLQSQKLNEANHWNGHNTVTLMQSTWTLCLATAFLLAVFAMPSFLSTKQHGTTGCLVSKISRQVVSLVPFGNFGPRQVHWLSAFIVTVTLNSSVTRSAIISSATVPKLLPLLLSTSRQMDWWNCTGKSWSTWLEHI
jgi:hypothetical protein